MLDIAQDHLLCHLHATGLFEYGLVFKGGTALRKCRSGSSGRFSTDLDFCGANRELTELVFQTIDGYSCHGFTYELFDVDLTTGRAGLGVRAPLTRRPPHPPGRIGIAAKVELSPRPAWLPIDTLRVVDSATHIALDHQLIELPVLSVPESIAEKLARYCRTPLARDLYDLVWYGQFALDEGLTRRLWVQKVYGDAVVDGRWSRAFDPHLILQPRAPSSIRDESIGFLTQPADIAKWEVSFRIRYRFLSALDDGDLAWAACNPHDRYHFDQLPVRYRTG